MLPETEISAVMGSQMRLMPTTGNLCHYVATQGNAERSVMVVAHRVETPRPHTSYTVEVIEPAAQSQTAIRERHSLVALIPRPGPVAER